MGHPYIDITWQRFGKLTAEKYLGDSMWMCTCDCGSQHVTKSQNLRRGDTKSCGCGKSDFIRASRDFKDMSDRKFHRLSVIERDDTVHSDGMAYWKCECDCGNIVIVCGKHLRSGKTKSCGCYRYDMAKERGKKSHGTAAITKIMAGYKRGAANRGFSFDLSGDDFKKLVAQNCYYCGDEPSNVLVKYNRYEHKPFYYSGIDRVDSDVGYTIENCVSCCKICNKMKMTLSADEFLSHASKIYRHSQDMPEGGE